MPAAIPFLSSDPDPGGLLYGSDGSTSGSPVQGIARSPMNDAGLTGTDSPTGTTVIAGSGNTNVYVGVLVLAALLGMVAWHYGGFDAHLHLGGR